MNRLQVGIILIGKGLLCSGLHLLAVLLELGVVDLHLGGSKSGGSNEFLEWGSVSADRKHGESDIRTSWGLPTILRASQRKGFSKL